MKKTLTGDRHNIMCAQWVQIMEQLNIGAFTIDRRRKITSLNSTAESMSGVKSDESIGRDCREVFSRIPCHLKCPFAEDDTPSAGSPVVELIDNQGTRHVVTRLAAPLYDRRRNIVGCLTVFQDHSPIADLINRVNYEERTLKIILDNLDIGVFAVNKGGHISFFNTAAELISGYNRREVLGRKFDSIFRGERVADFMRLSASTQNAEARSSGKMEIITHEDEKIPIRSEYMPLRNELGNIVGGLAMFQDLTVAQHMDKVISDRIAFHQMIGKSTAMRKVFAMVNVVAGTESTVLIQGSTGTGKDLLAKVIHTISKRAHKPFVKVNCASLPHNLLESELFGYARGAFTGADKDKPGRFQEADGGTILLDEIGDLPLSLQAKLLRVIEDKEFYPLGGRRTMKVDVRIISATNRDLENLAAEKEFREDLFYRLNVLRIDLPELKERTDDIPILIRHILKRLSARGEEKPREISEKAMEMLLNYDYPGNIRELENILEHAAVLCQADLIDKDHLPPYVRKRLASRRRKQRIQKTESRNAEKESIIQTLEQCGGNRTLAAKTLGVNRTTLWRKMKKLNIPL